MNSNSSEHLSLVAVQFGAASNHAISGLTEGLIHQTYRVQSGELDFILQQVNTNVFREPRHLIENYSRVYDHLHSSGKLKIPSPLTTINGDILLQDDQHRYWRAYRFIQNSFTAKLPIAPTLAAKAAKSFGQLTCELADLDSDYIHEVIPGFHNLSGRFQQFNDALQQKKNDRHAKAINLIQEILKRKKYVHFFEWLIKNNSFKRRIMHHDSKLSNILFDSATDEAVCQIDLDTLMPGYYFSDLGDLIRSMASTADESETHLDSIIIQIEMYDALVDGYLEGIAGELTPEETKHIHLAGLLMTYMQALRFLTDYLKHDSYYKTRYQEENYDRALNQITLLQRLETFLTTVRHIDISIQ